MPSTFVAQSAPSFAIRVRPVEGVGALSGGSPGRPRACGRSLRGLGGFSPLLVWVLGDACSGGRSAEQMVPGREGLKGGGEAKEVEIQALNSVERA